MAGAGKNMFDLRISNRVAVLNLLYARGGLSRKEIAAQLNLTPPAISHIVGDLIEEGVLVETKKVEGSSRMGRREIILEIDRTRFKVLCAYIPTRNVRISCIDLAGHIDFCKELRFDASIGGEDILHGICDEMQAYLHRMDDAQRRQVIGVGLGIKGIYDDRRGVSVKSFGLWEDNLPVQRIVQDRLSMKVLVNNDIRCIANAETLFHHYEDIHSMLFVKHGPLVGGAFVLNGGLFKGFGYQAMELAHFIVDPLGSVCRCGKRGCLETVVGFDVIASHLRIQYTASRMPILYELTGGDKEAITMETIIESFDRGEYIVREMLDSSLDRFALMLVDAIGLVDPEKVVLYGYPFESEAFVALLKEKIQKISCGNVRTSIEKSRRNLALEDRGCASIVIDDFLQNGAIFAAPGTAAAPRDAAEPWA